jgi:hypothetical protein
MEAGEILQARIERPMFLMTRKLLKRMHDWIRTNDLFRVKAGGNAFSTTYMWIRELPITLNYLQERHSQQILGLEFGSASIQDSS